MCLTVFLINKELLKSMGQRAQTVGEGRQGCWTKLCDFIAMLCEQAHGGKDFRWLRNILKALAHFHVNAKLKSGPTISPLRLTKIKPLGHSLGSLGGLWPQVVMGDVYSMLWVVTWPHPSDVRWAHCWCNSFTARFLFCIYTARHAVAATGKVVYYRKLEMTHFISQELSLAQNRKSASLYQRWGLIPWAVGTLVHNWPYVDKQQICKMMNLLGLLCGK